ncbi:hypothetical protein [Streptosporangium sp. NPDC000509]|uniref:hypothetical protein n=1 Tax=Streptosporangium sp. NPDC000509 TaxID=3366186 RepID=UPI0036986934
MGDVFWGLHTPLAAGLIRAQGITAAYETGTHFGFGALQLAAMMENVWTVEADQGLFNFCVDTYADLTKVHFIEGESSRALRSYAAGMEQPTLFVLDAHWFPVSPRADYRPDNLCPVIDELLAIKSCPAALLESSAVIVDDAQMFLGSLKVPFVRSTLPSIKQVIDLVDSCFERTVVTDDVIIGCADVGVAAIEEYLNWRDVLKFP